MPSLRAYLRGNPAGAFDPTTALDRFLRPEQPLRETVERRATESALEYARSVLGSRPRVAEVRAVLQTPELVAMVWEAVAPAGWVGDERRVFLGPEHLEARVTSAQDDANASYPQPLRLGDVIALASDPEGVLASEALVEEAVARLAPWGFRSPPTVGWLSARPNIQDWGEHSPLEAVSTVVAWSIMWAAEDGWGPYDLTDGAFRQLERALGVRRPMPSRITDYTWLRGLAARQVVGHVAWEQARQEGLRLDQPSRGGGSSSLRRDRHPLLRRLPAGMGQTRYADLAGPFDPMVQVLTRGYVATLDDRQEVYAKDMVVFQGTRLFFRREDWAPDFARRLAR